MQRMGRPVASCAAVVAMLAALACRSPAPPAPAPAPAPVPSAPPPDAIVFEYTGTDGDFAYGVTLHANGAWTQREHSGSAPPAGVLDAAALARFLAALDAAPFSTTSAPCALPAPGRATYRDVRRGRTAAASSRLDPDRGWVPCGDTVDAATARLPGCLTLLIDGSDAGC